MSEAQGMKKCARCESTVPMLVISQDGYVHVNWQDLRVLVTFARRWSKHFDMTRDHSYFTVMTLDRIINDLREYQPRGAKDLMDETEEQTIIQAQERARTNYLVKPADARPIKDMLKKGENGLILSPFFKKGKLY